MSTVKIEAFRNYNSKYFPLPLHLDFIDGVMWELLGDFEYHRENGEIIKVPKGFLTDGASIPRPVWSIIGHPLAEYAPAAVVHDYMCTMNPWPRSKTDRIFLEALRDLDVAFLKRYTMFLFVRVWSFF